MKEKLPKLYAIIAVANRGDRTFYVRRSNKMENYPGVWSLPSVRFDPVQLPDIRNLERVQGYMNRMSVERLGGVPVIARRLLTTGDSADNPISQHVFLYLYEVDLPTPPQLNSDYYVDSAWMTAAEYEGACKGQQCGLCLRLWSDYAWMAGITDRPFIPRTDSDAA